MKQSVAKPSIQGRPRRWKFWDRLKEIDMFFEGRGKEHQTLRRLVKRLDAAGIAYAIVGGMAVNAHHYERTTRDVDVLLTLEGFREFRRCYVPRSYRPVRGSTRRVVDPKYNVSIDILVTGLFPGSGKPGPIAYPDPAEVGERIDQIHFVNLATLIQLKLAAGRLKDATDVVDLIRANDLDESFAAHLHPSVREDFLEYLEERRRDDVYEARQEAALRKKLEADVKKKKKYPS
jgi:hypothetical protein